MSVVSRFLLVNPRSGGESPTAAELAASARRMGVEVRELRAGDDAGALARAALERGASVVGVAGGDGSLAPVASAAIDGDVPFVPVPFGTRNNFARDSGFDPGDPLAALAAFEGVERRVDVGTVAGRLFVNNVSLGLYASLVHDPGHVTKNRLVALGRMLPAAFGRSRRPLDLSFEITGRRERRRALIVVIGNNEYERASLAEFGSRRRLDAGLLHAYVIEAAARRTLVALLARAVVGRLNRATGWAEWAASSFRVDSPRRRIHAAVDGEAVILEPPLELEVRPRALRVLAPDL